MLTHDHMHLGTIIVLALQEEAMGLARGAAKIKASVQKWDELVQVVARRKHIP